MIQLEYDVDTAGVRVSFVIEDSEEGSSNCLKLCDMGKMVECIWQVPQTVETLNIVGRLLNASRKQADGEERVWDGSRRRAELYRILKQRSSELQP